MAAKPDYYKVLGVPRDADEDAVKKAFRELAKQHHPDLNPGNAASESLFKAINEAYTVLSDAGERRSYDANNRFAGLTPKMYQKTQNPDMGPEQRDRASRYASRQAAGATDGYAYREGSPSTDWREHIDLNEWNRMHFGPDAGDSARWTAERVKDAHARGFSFVNDARYADHANYEARRNAKHEAGEWAAAQASRGPSETRSYRVWAAAYRANAAAEARALPKQVFAVLALLGVGYLLAGKISSSAGPVRDRPGPVAARPAAVPHRVTSSGGRPTGQVALTQSGPGRPA